MSDEKQFNPDRYIPEGWEGKYPPCLIQVDAEGQLSHNGAPMIHKGILETIYENVHYEDGDYVLRLGKQVCQLEVEDTFYVVTRADLQGGQIMLSLNDGSSEPLDPSGLRVGGGDVLYCTVKGGACPARFLRPAYYQISQMFVETEGGFGLELAGKIYPLAMD